MSPPPHANASVQGAPWSLETGPAPRAEVAVGDADSSVRVLFLFAHLHKGGMQRAVCNITRALPAEFQNTVAFFGTENPGYDFRGDLEDLELPGDADAGLWRRVRRVAARLKAVRSLVRRRRPDVVVSFGEGAAIYNLLSGAPRRILSVRVSLAEAFREMKPLYRRIYRLVVRHAYRYADAVVVNSRQLGDEVAECCRLAGSERLQVIPNLFHLGEIEAQSRAPLPPEWEAAFRRPVVLSVGSLIPQKGQRHLVSAYARVASRHPEARLVLVGRGDDEASLRRQCVELGLADRVVFAGHQRNPYAFLARCRVFVLSSLYEGLPNALIEAMACGVPVVSTDCPTGPREILSPTGTSTDPAVDAVEEARFGLLVPPFSSSTPERDRRTEALLAEAIERHLQQEEWAKRSGRRARERAEDFSAERVVGKWVALLRPQRIAGSAAPPRRTIFS